MTEEENWGKVWAACSPGGFLWMPWAQIKEGVSEVNRRLKPIDDASVPVSYRCWAGDARALFSEEPLGKIVLEWDEKTPPCATEFCGKTISMVDLRREPLGSRFFE